MGNAIAHASWLEDDHANIASLKDLMNWPKAAHWTLFRFHGESALEELPESFVMEESDDSFILKAEQIWIEPDSIFLEVMNSLTKDLRLPVEKLTRLEASLHEIDNGAIQQLGRPSPQLIMGSR